jgi:predicted PurR-regulated permease PerM
MMVTSLILVTVTIFVVLGLAVMRLLKMIIKQSERIASLQNQLTALCEGASGVDERILKFENSLTKLRDHQHTMDMTSASQPSYDHAIRLAKRGANINQIIDNCNVSDEEAHLISRLHGQVQTH